MLIRLRTLGRRVSPTSAPGCRNRCSPRPTWPRTSSWPDSVSMAVLLVLETLTPTERAVFVLREVFDVGYDEIAEAVDKTPAAIRQIAHRARGTRRRAPAARSCRRPRRATRSTRSSERPTRAICRACSTSSRRTSSSWVTVAEPGRPSCGSVVGAGQGCPRAGRRAGHDAPRRCSRHRSTGYPERDSSVRRRGAPSWRCASTTASSPGSTPSAIPRSCRTWSGDRAAPLSPGGRPAHHHEAEPARPASGDPGLVWSGSKEPSEEGELEVRRRLQPGIQWIPRSRVGAAMTSPPAPPAAGRSRRRRRPGTRLDGSGDLAAHLDLVDECRLVLVDEFERRAAGVGRTTARGRRRSRRAGASRARPDRTRRRPPSPRR